MSRFGNLGSLRPRSSSTGGGLKRNVDVDPVMAAILGLVVVGGGGLAFYGASQETEPAPAPAAVAQQSDPVVERALRIVERVDGTAAAGEGASAEDVARERRRAERASAAGRSADPFAAIASGTSAVTGVGAAATPGSTAGVASGSSSTASTGASGSGAASSSTSSSSSGSGAGRAKTLAERAAAQSAARNAAADGSTPNASTAGGSSSTRKPSAAATRAAALRAVAGRPARISLRIKTDTGRSTRSKRSMGLLVPTSKTTVARIIGVSRSNQVVTLRLREGAALAGKQSKGTRCVERTGSGDCRLVRVRTGRTAVIRAPESASGRPGTVTALRVTAIWRGGYKVAG